MGANLPCVLALFVVGPMEKYKRQGKWQQGLGALAALLTKGFFCCSTWHSWQKRLFLSTSTKNILKKRNRLRSLGLRRPLTKGHGACKGLSHWPLTNRPWRAALFFDKRNNLALISFTQRAQVALFHPQQLVP